MRSPATTSSSIRRATSSPSRRARAKAACGRRSSRNRPPSETPVSKLNAQRLRTRYKTRTVVQDVSLEVGGGEVGGGAGPNGAGKTTCLYMIVGLVPVDAGRSLHEKGDFTH